MKPIVIPADDREAAIQEVARFLAACFPGKKLALTVEAWKQERSSRQNRALFGHAYRVICEETGADKDELHRDFCIAFFGLRVQKCMDFEHRMPLRTTTHDENGERDVIGMDEFRVFYADVERKASEFGIFIPAPDPRWFLND